LSEEGKKTSGMIAGRRACVPCEALTTPALLSQRERREKNEE
jgi:hypothetical protein